MFANLPVAKARHMKNSKVNVGGDRKTKKKEKEKGRVGYREATD